MVLRTLAFALGGEAIIGSWAEDCNMPDIEIVLAVLCGIDCRGPGMGA